MSDRANHNLTVGVGAVRRILALIGAIFVLYVAGAGATYGDVEWWPPYHSLYQRHAGGAIWSYTGTPCQGDACPGWALRDNNPETRQIAAGFNEVYQLHAGGRIYRDMGSGWSLIGSEPLTRHIAAGSGRIYRLQTDGSIERYTEWVCGTRLCKDWVALDNGPDNAAVAVAANWRHSHNLYRLTSNGSIYRYTGRPCDRERMCLPRGPCFPFGELRCLGWQQIGAPADVRMIAAGYGGRVYRLLTSGRIERYTVDLPTWQVIDDNPETVQLSVIGNASTDYLCQLQRSGRVYCLLKSYLTGRSGEYWELCDTNPETVSITTANGGPGSFRLYQRHRDGSIYVYTFPGWTRLDNNPQTVELAAYWSQGE